MSQSPPVKKAKMADIDTLMNTLRDSKENLRAVVKDELENPIPVGKVYVCHILDKKLTSQIIHDLNSSLVLHNLQHLKRVHRGIVILCSVSYVSEQGFDSIEELLQKVTPQWEKYFSQINELDVPLTPPKTKAQNTECLKHWPCNFHPDKYLEKLLSTSFFSQSELTLHRHYLSMAVDITNWYLIRNNLMLSAEELKLSEYNAAVVVDPTINSVVAIGIDNRINHPIQHSVMLAIDKVAETQTGGVWKEDALLKNINEDLLSHLKDKYQDVKFGAKKYVKKNELKEGEIGPYLCTGYYMYLLREPCLMCGMAIVHARVKRVFFTYDNVKMGALKSKVKLQCTPAINHNFEVFTLYDNL